MITQEAESPRGYQILDGTTLKLIAMACMVIDHVGDLFFPGVMWMRAIGRIAMPVFSFCIAEGYIHTHDRQRYLQRMGLFALVSELPFDLMSAGHLGLDHQNIMCSFFLAICALMLYDLAVDRLEGARGVACGFFVVVLIGIAALLLATDYNFTVVLLVFVYYFFRERGTVIRNLAGAVVQAALRNVGIYVWGLLSVPILMLYNGKRGRGLKMLFYVFYPAHMLLLYGLKLLLKS